MRRGCSHPEELHRVAGGLEGRHTGFEVGRHKVTDQEGRHKETAGPAVLHTGTVVQEEHHMEMARAVRHKETAQGVHHREKEQGVRRRAIELEVVRHKAIVQGAVVLGGKEEHHIGLKAEGQRA